MPKISQYTQVQSVNANDKILLNQTVGAETDTYSASIEQVGDNIAGTQQHADLETESKTIIGGINENKDKVGDLSTLTTSVKSSIVGAVNEVDGKTTSFIYTDSTVTDFITLFASIPNNKTVGFLMNSGSVSNCPVPYPTGVISKWNSNTAFIELTQLNGTDASYIGRIFSGNLTWRKITTTTV